jgi:chromosome segregation ATPase
VEAERDDLRESVSRLRASEEALQLASRKADDLDQRAAAAGNENAKLQRHIATVQKRLDDLTADHATVEAENHKLQKSLETLKVIYVTVLST